MANNYYDSEEFRIILKSFEESEKTGKNLFFGSGDLLDIADYYCLHGKVPEARAIVDRALETFPDSDEALLMKSRMALTYDHDPDEAEIIADMVNDKHDADYAYLKAEIMLSRGLEDEAEALLQKVYDEADDEEPEVIAEEITRIYADYNNVALAKKWFERTGNSDSASKKELKVRLLIADGNIEEGQKMLNELIDDDPYNSLYWNLLSSTQYLSDDIEDAITSSEYSLAINPNDEEAILNKANGLYKLGNYEDAIDYYKRFVRIRPDEESGEMMIGISLIALNRVQEGVEYLKKAEKKISIDSTHNDEIYQELVIALSKLNRFDEALAYIKRSESAECEHNEMKVLEGFVLMKKDDLEGGRECYQQALTDSGYSPVIYLKIGMALYENHLYSAAYMTTKSLLNICPDEMSEAYAYHALFCYFVRKDDEYMEYRKIAFEKDPKLAEMVLGEIRL